MSPEEIAQRVLDQNGQWMVSELGADGVGDMVWDVYPAYQKMAPEQMRKVVADVTKVLFG